MRIAYIFTTFPKLSEQFVRRDVFELRRQGISVDFYSIFRGNDLPEGDRVFRMGSKDWCLVPIGMVYWLFRKPRVLFEGLSMLLPFHYRSFINFCENFLGFAFVMRYARDLSSDAYSYLHATWATAPGMVVYLTHRLNGCPYTLEAHAYDIYRDGGDAFLLIKLLNARVIRVSTEAAKQELEARLAEAACGFEGRIPNVINVRNGLTMIPGFLPNKWGGEQPIRALSVGRLIEKKGYFHQLEIYSQWQQTGVDFEAFIVGGGPLHKKLIEVIRAKGLEGRVHLTGELEHEQVVDFYRRSNAFLFTGEISRSGDRDGFPNVVGEAMAHSVPVFVSGVAGIPEVISDGVNGRIIDLSDPKQAAERILADLADPVAVSDRARAAHKWVEDNFSIRSNVEALRYVLWGSSDGISE